jgi:D-alanyl-D-alanine carboxypeptidase (penicillin-binding protein 5/6)
MASTTKIMTAVVVLEHGNLDDVITVDRLAASVGQSSMRLRVGEKITERELLKGVLVQSGNDAATLIAEHVGGTVPNFVKMMNAEAARLNLVNTHYMNPHGLDTPGHYTSPDDLTALARYAMTFPLFREIVRHHSLTVRSNKYTHVLVSQNVLLLKYKGAEGIKTGWTNNAGYCVVVAAKRGPIELIGTIMGTNTEPGRAQQAKALLDWGFRNYRVSRIATAGAILGRVPISDYMERTVAAETAVTTATPVFAMAGPLGRRVVLDPSVAAPVRKGQVLGTVTVLQGQTMVAQLPLTAASSVPEPSAWQRIEFLFGRIWRGVFG